MLSQHDVWLLSTLARRRRIGSAFAQWQPASDGWLHFLGLWVIRGLDR